MPSIFKVVGVATVALTAAVLMVTNNFNHPSSMALFQSTDPSTRLVEQEFVKFIAKYGRVYASKEEISAKFATF